MQADCAAPTTNSPTTCLAPIQRSSPSCTSDHVLVDPSIHSPRKFGNFKMASRVFTDDEHVRDSPEVVKKVRISGTSIAKKKKLKQTRLREVNVKLGEVEHEQLVRIGYGTFHGLEKGWRPKATLQTFDALSMSEVSSLAELK